MNEFHASIITVDEERNGVIIRIFNDQKMTAAKGGKKYKV